MIPFSVRPLPHTPGTYSVPPREYDIPRRRGDPHFNMQMKFGDEHCGQLLYEDNQLKFTGSFQTSGRIFAEFIWHKFKEWYVKEKIADRDLYPEYHDPEMLRFRKDKPSFTLTFDLDGKAIGKFFYEDNQLKFEGNADEAAYTWVDWVIEKFQEWHDEAVIR